MGKGRLSVKIIRKECAACMGGNSTYIKGCKDRACSLYHFRLGKNPNIQLSEEERNKRAEIIRRNRENSLLPR